MVGRCRELILCFAIDFSRGELHESSSSSFQSLLDLCRDDEVARTVAKCLGRCDQSTKVTVNSRFSSILNGYMRLLRKEKHCHEHFGTTVTKLARHTLEGVLLPRLVRPPLKCRDRLAPLRLLRQMLEIVESDRNDEPLAGGLVDLKLLCSVLRSLSASLCAIVAEPEVDDYFNGRGKV